MTNSADLAPAAEALAPQPGTLAATLATDPGLLWYLARCHRCTAESVADEGQPFRSEDERDEWAAAHVTTTGHVVHLFVDGLQDLPQVHLSGIISRAAVGDFRFVCPAEPCGRSNGPYSSAMLAITSWRAHPVRVKVPA